MPMNIAEIHLVSDCFFGLGTGFFDFFEKTLVKTASKSPYSEGGCSNDE